MSVRVFPTVEALAEALAGQMALVAAQAIALRGRFTCALTGGSAAEVLYPALAAAPLDWPRVHLYQGDERCVPPDDPRSNGKLARACFGRTGATLHLVDGTRPPAEAAAAYPVPPVLDVVHLGMGPDGHVCSLFPLHRLLHEREARVAAITDSPKPPAERVTLTLRALHDARALVFLVLGEAKRQAVHEALELPGSALPAALAHRGHRDSQWYLDPGAASALKPGLASNV